MASFIKAADAIAAAVEIERRGHKFYDQARKDAASSADAEFFAFMAGEELRHEKIFESMLQRAGGLDLPIGSSDAEYLEYVKAVLDSHLLFLPSKSIAGQDPYQLALRFEKDTIVYFLSMLDLVPSAEQKLVKQCIEEEKKHIRLIAQKQKERK